MLTLWNQFDDLFADDFFKNRRQVARSFVPAVDVEETKDGYVLTADVPGVKPENIEITVEDGVLTLQGTREAEARQEKEGYRRIERSFGSFRRSFVLPKGVNSEGVEARVEDGQLRVRVPKPVQAVPRKVTVQIPGASGSTPTSSAA